uniref:CDK-activating kinase assembly factor MAT1 n=1 Tax=Tanacetum cinerariifolium TaxID=118510 RepID=A0A699H6J2_TANCI|nr:CDK-activating kinase assembly factor MAT1 [Tanacetum cinerariifolium]
MVVGSHTNSFAKEMTIRKRIGNIFNKRVEDFSSLREYNDYLEDVEDMIVDLVDGNNVPFLEAKIARYQKENAEQIMNAQARKAEEYAAALAASKGQLAQPDVDMTAGTSSQFGATSDGSYVPAVAGGQIPQPRPTKPLPMGAGDDLHAYHMDDEEMMRLKAEHGGKAGGWSLELSRKRALEEAFTSIWI